MSDHPFHIVGGSFPAQPFNPSLPAAELPTVVKGSRRRKLWEIPHKFHCPVIGVCFDVDELRGLMTKLMHFPRETTNFVLHMTAVGACEERSQLADILHKHLGKRFQLTVRCFAAARDSKALWACWTHPTCDAKLEQQIYRDIHMIQHQVGSGSRADLAMLKSLRADEACGRPGGGTGHGATAAGTSRSGAPAIFRQR